MKGESELSTDDPVGLAYLLLCRCISELESLAEGLGKTLRSDEPKIL